MKYIIEWDSLHSYNEDEPKNTERIVQDLDYRVNNICVEPLRMFLIKRIHML